MPHPLPFLATAALLALALALPPAGAADVAAQRAAFLKALPQAEAGRWDRVEPLLGELRGYPLLPDLRAAWFHSAVGRIDDEELGAFLAQYPDLGFSAELRRQWAASLARRGEWRRYLALYEDSYAGAGDIELHCQAYTARIRLERTVDLADAVLASWLSPISLPQACDPAFEWLERQGALPAERRRERIGLALQAGQFGLARWLARPLGDAALGEVERWQRMHSHPQAQLGRPAEWRDAPAERALVLHGFRRLAANDPAAAAERWAVFREQLGFSREERGAVDRHIALLHAWRHLPGARTQLEALPEELRDADTRAWALRAALREQDWDATEQLLSKLEPETAVQPVWRYWQARLLETRGRSNEARPLYAELAGERGYYSFLSADRLNADYNWRHARTPPDEELIAALERRPDIVRARELFFTGRDAHGRHEWQQAMARLSPPERAQAGHLASRWGWYSRAITAATAAELPDDLELRFPLAWRPVFEERSRLAGIDIAWAYGVARSESLFMPDVSSTAGAVGLMQLLPGTGRQTAARAGISFQGHSTLLDPDANVALGTTYLAKMLERYGNHRVLATAAYNAGPARVDRWLPLEAPLPADAWVDSLPFSETRGYVQRVLASEAVFRWRMSGETVRLADAMQPVPPKAGR